MGTQANASAESISIPQGGGALQGIGEKFSPDLFTGTGNFSVPLTVPPGRGGLQPQLSLDYSTGSGNGPFGLGWSLAAPTISRKTSKGVPRYGDGDVFILSGSEDLVPVPGAPAGAQRYRPRTEGLFARIDHHLDTDEWEVQTRDGMVSRYGAAQGDGVRAVVRDPDDEGKVFSWHLTETADPSGNLVRYEYLRDRGSDAFHHWDQLYLRRILYADYTGPEGDTRFLASVELVYEDRPDPFSDHRAGFEVRTRKRCKRIEIRTHAGEDRLVRSYGLAYVDQVSGWSGPAAGSRVSLLARVVVTGHDGEKAKQLPPLEFGYTRFRPGERRFFPVLGPELPARSLADGDLELVDLFGSGLPDLLEMNGTVRYWRNLGGGRFDRPRSMRNAPAGVQLGDPGVQLIDANGDGRTDLLVTSGPVAGYYSLAFNGEWDARSFRPYAAAPSFDLADPEVRLVDLDGDGVTDALRAGSRLECFFNDPAEGWGETRYVDRGALAELRGLTFADPRVRLADMGGDGLPDLVLVHDGRVDYWPAQGRGKWGKRVTMRNSPGFPAGYDPRRILLGDVDGDGVADLVYVDDRSVTLWLNQSGNGWSGPVTIHGTPRVTDVDSVRLADLLGNGIAGVLWSAEPRPGRHPLHFLDFTGGVKPYLLDEMDNRTGAVTRVEYAPSTRFYLADQARPETRWQTTLPFPVHVVARSEAVDLLSGGKLTTEYTYHHGYWDGEEREFRGFARVDRRDTETFEDQETAGSRGGPQSSAVAAEAFSPPVETRTWFHPGPVEDGAGGWKRPDFRAEFWSEPFPGGETATLLPTAAEMGVLLPDLPPRARRDALRALRGQVLRAELYARDGTPLQSRPYTVTERTVGLREVDPPGAAQSRPRVFFPHLLAERTTRWERGDDPMTRFSFTGDYDAHGQPRMQLSVAVPRGRDPRSEGEWTEPYLATQTVTGYAVAPEGGRFIADRVAHATTWEIAGVRTGSVRALRNAVFVGAGGITRKLAGQTLSFYDGEAFGGLPLGEVGSRGAPVRSEQLVLTPEILQQAYGDELPPYFAGDGADWSGYPEEFRDMVSSGTGYVWRTATEGSPAVTGWYAPTALREYDFHSSTWHPRGLVRRIRDALGRDTRIRYDRYQLLTRKVVDAAGLVTLAAHDYRTLKPRRVRDPNGSRVEVVYTPLGMVAAVAAMGKKGEAVGDTPEAPGTRFHYDLHAFAARGEPVRVRAERRIHHAGDTEVPLPERDATISTVEYSDGFGRLLQTRAQAEDVVFGGGVFGEGVLPLDRGHDAADVVGHVPASGPRVVVSGWQVYDNKGRVVEKYEPFFSTGWSFAPAAEAELGRKVVQYHDPRGQVVRTVHPDGSEERVIQGVPAALDLGASPEIAWTPWEAYTYDAADNAGRTHPEASAGWAHHRNTPASAVVDALGRAVRAVARTRAGTQESDPVQEHRTRTEYDFQGRVLAVTDALGREVARTVYDLAGRALRAVSLDAGTSVSALDALGRLLEARDAKGARSLRAYDALGRPTRIWSRDRAGDPTTLRERMEYGDGGDAAQDPASRQAARALNQLGRLARHYDEAGLAAVEAYDFRGNPREKTRRTIRDAHLLQTFTAAARNEWRLAPFRVEWTPPAGVPFADHAAGLLEEGEHRTSLRHDALGRVQALRTPADPAGVRHEIRPGYNPAGGLERVALDGQTYVDHIAYDARGQRTLIAYGNGVMTRYAYHRDTSRLLRLRSERYVKMAEAPLTYRPAPRAGEGHPLQDLEYAYDLSGSPLMITDRTPGSGVLDNPDAAAFQQSDPALAALLASGDALVRRFTYDPLGRLVSATGREDAATPMPRPWHDAPRAGFGSGGHATPDQENAPALTQLYTEMYGYDPAGNLTGLLHFGGSGGWTRRFGFGGRTHAAWEALWTAHAGGEPWPGAPGNRLTHAGDNDAASPQSHFFDACGNLVRQNLDRHFTWDGANQLRLYRTQVAASGSTPEEDRWAEPSVAALYLYDAAGQRVKKLVRRQGGAVEVTLYVDRFFERHRWTRTDGTGGECALVHVMDDQRRIAVARFGNRHPDDGGPAVQYHLGDHLGSSGLVLDGAGGWVNREEHTPYGETSFGSFARKRYRFTGKERDEESGLYYHGARYYAPWLCRWASCDPAGLVDGPNVYAYCRGRPLALSDPGGMTSVDDAALTSAKDAELVQNIPGEITEWEFFTDGGEEFGPDSEGGGGADAPDAPAPAEPTPAESGTQPPDLGALAPAGSALTSAGSVLSQAGSNAGRTTSILWTGKNALAGALEMGTKLPGAFRSLESSLLGKASYALSNPVLKLTGKAEWAKNALYHAIWKPVSRIYGFHAGIAGHSLLKLMQTDLPIDPKYGFGSIMRNIESPMYRLGRSLIAPAQKLGRYLPVVGGLLSGAALAHSYATGDVAEGVGAALGVAQVAALAVGATSAAAVLGAAGIGYGIGTLVYNHVLGGPNGKVNVKIQDFFLWVGGYK